MKKKNPIQIVLVVLLITTMACSFSGSTPAPIETPVHLEPYTPSFQVITIPTRMDLTQPTQAPLYFLDTGGGHYLLYVYETGKLIYDGRELYSGQLADVYGGWSTALSPNGQHYAYVIPGTDGPDFTDLYVDGVKVESAQYLLQPALTDDADYFYTACSSATGFSGSCLFKNGADIFLAENGILEYWVNVDGSTYYALLRDPQSLVRNGEVIYQGIELAHKSFSPNGAHYAYVSHDENGMQHLVVDGVVVRSSTALFVDQVTDLGAYCAWDSANQLVFINGVEFPVQGNSRIECHINEDASHSLIHDEGNWLLDGNPVQFPDLNPADTIVNVEMKGDTWVVYRVVK
jgi:hypothetical protein